MTTTTIDTTASFRVGDRVCRVYSDRTCAASIGYVRRVVGRLVLVHWAGRADAYPVNVANLEPAPLSTV